MSPPSLHHQQEVKMTAVQRVICLKIIARTFHESFYLTAEQCLGEQIAIVESFTGAAFVPYGHRYGSLHGCFYLQCSLVVGLQHGRHPAHNGLAGHHFILTAEQQPVCPHLSASVKDRHLRHSCIQTRLGNTHASCLYCALVPYRTVLHDSHSQRNIP